MNKLFLPLCFLAFCLQIQAQRRGPEQDCPGALFICGNNFTQLGGYVGAGKNNNELSPNTCLFDGSNNAPEQNSVWYTFTIANAGSLSFLIEPLDTSSKNGNDYDFDLYNVTGHTCGDIATGVAPEVRCSFGLSTGKPTGIAPGGADTTWASVEGSPILEPLQVQSGQTFKLLVDNLQSNVAGFTMDFSQSTCTFVNSSNQPFFNKNIDSVIGNPIVVDLNYFVYCDSIDSSGANFTFIGPAGVHIKQVLPNGKCTGTTNSLIVTLDSTLPIGSTYALAYKAFTFASPCGNVLTAPDTLQVYQDTSRLVNGIAETDAGQNISIFPNPTNGKVQIKLPPAKGKTYLQLYNTFGQLMAQNETDAGNTTAQIDLANLPAATYMLLINLGDGRYYQKLVVKY